MALIDPPIPELGQPNSTEDADIRSALQAILTLVNGQLDTANITDGSLTGDDLQQAVREALGLTGGGQVRRGKSIVPAEQSRANVAYGLLDTPDRVSSVVLPTNGLILIGFHALWKESNANSAQAGLFLGGNQVKRQSFGGAPGNAETATGSGGMVNRYMSLATSAGAGLQSADPAGVDETTVATGQLVGVMDGGLSAIDRYGGLAAVWADAGTYDVSVQFKAIAGSVTVKERKLWAIALGF